LKLKAWRLIKPEYIDFSFIGDGAKKYGGRWNNKGTSLIYTSSTLSLAAMELLTHLEYTQVLRKYYKISIELDSRSVLDLNINDLPSNWWDHSTYHETQIIGDHWVKSGASCILKVPSSVIKEEFNYLINPVHTDFKKIKIGQPSNFNFDPRLIKPVRK
jgi:RES domain-containing protein